jgi:hypothetical protein
MECRPLNNLSSEQRNFCSQNLKTAAVGAKALLKRNQVKFNWTREDIYIRDYQKTITADAVANSENNNITINIDRFLSLSGTERLFLLAHEIFHLTPLQNKYIDDSSTIGPFDGPQGSRNLLNSMASGLVMTASKTYILEKYRPALNRRKAYKKRWLDFDLSSVSLKTKEDGNAFAPESYGGVSFEYKQYFTNFGFNLSLDLNNSNETILDTIDVKDRIQILGAGLSYRFFLFKDPLTIWGQSFLSLNANAEYLRSKLTAQDGQTNLSSKENSLGWSLELKYYIPLPLCWVHFGAGVRPHDYEHEEFASENNRLINNEIQTTFNIGVSHAF